MWNPRDSQPAGARLFRTFPQDDRPADGGRGALAGRLALGMTLALGAAVLAGPAYADPCKAIPDRGPLPDYLARGKTFSGPVVHVGDGDSLCVARGRGPDTWVEVRLADFYAPELREPGGEQAKAALVRLVSGRRLTCTAQHRSYDRIVAVCRLNGRSVADLMRAAGVREGGRGR